jgi:recombinational DNA repair ATPase RecF
MKILDLKIEKMRGIKEIKLTPNGNNLVIWGPNGSGKSAVVDALDFLLTGSISRFTGKGTGCITLSEHGPHVDHHPIDAIVSAKIQIPASSEPIEIRRCMAKPSNLECDAEARRLLEPIISIAQNGQYVLTRREILKYITADPSTRAKEIQDYLTSPR